MPRSLDTSQIQDWRSIVTLIVFVLTNLVVLFPFHIPIYVPRRFWHAVLDALSRGRVTAPRQHGSDVDLHGKARTFKKLRFPLNFVTAPLIADLFLLAISAIGRQEVHDGTIGADNISPLDVLIFFLTLAYIAISIDASGLIRYLAFKVLQWGGKAGHKLYFYLYLFFFGLGSFIGNDPIILSGTAFLAYMTRVSSNILHPRAWIHAQFAVANIASAILVSSNPTNLVLAGAFKIKFIHYTANMIVPVIITAIVLFPFLLYVFFADDDLIPSKIEMHELPEEARIRKPVNPNIPHARGLAEEEENNLANEGQSKLLSLEEIMNPFVDKGGAAFGAVIMTATLVTILALNAASTSSGEHAVFWVTLPAAFVMFCWDVAFGWYHRRETREIARKGRREVERAHAERMIKEDEAKQAVLEQERQDALTASEYSQGEQILKEDGTKRKAQEQDPNHENAASADKLAQRTPMNSMKETNGAGLDQWQQDAMVAEGSPLVLTNSPEAQLHSENDAANAGDDKTLAANSTRLTDSSCVPSSTPTLLVPENSDAQPDVALMRKRDQSPEAHGHTQHRRVEMTSTRWTDEKEQGTNEKRQEVAEDPQYSDEKKEEIDMVKKDMDIEKRISHEMRRRQDRGQATLVTLVGDVYRWLQETFPTTTAVMGHLPVALVPFAFSMFVLVQALVTKGWVEVFAYGWDHWVNKTGTVGSIGGMGFLSVILCNFAGTNIGTTILLSRVIQSWQNIHRDGPPISDRTFWATVYSMALGVNYGAFSTAFSASLAGLLWRDILGRKHIHIQRRAFARQNLPIIAVAMTVGCVALIGEVYIFRDKSPYNL